MTCPKCPAGRMSGPRYHRNAYSQERLTYHCTTCGYSEDRPTADQQAADERQRARLLAIEAAGKVP